MQDKYRKGFSTKWKLLVRVIFEVIEEPLHYKLAMRKFKIFKNVISVLRKRWETERATIRLLFHYPNVHNIQEVGQEKASSLQLQPGVS